MIETIAPFRVLSIDGGGMRGLYTVAMLTALETIKYTAHAEPPDNKIPIANCFKCRCPTPGKTKADNKTALVDLFTNYRASKMPRDLKRKT